MANIDHVSHEHISPYCYANTPSPFATDLSSSKTMSTMFNALNRFISRLDSDGPVQSRDQGGFGFQVLRNKSLELAIEPWFDFIVGINGRMIVRTSVLGVASFTDGE